MSQPPQQTPPWAPPPGQYGPAYEPVSQPVPPPSPRALTTSLSLVTAALLIAVAALVPVPYAVTSPGPTLDTLGEAGGGPLIEVADATTYDSSGELRLTTVSVAGGEGSPISVLAMVIAWLDDARGVRPVEDIFPPQQSPEEIEEQNQAAMISSQEYATVAALEELGYQVPTTLVVAEPIQGTGAYGVLEEGDVLLAVGGVEVASFVELGERIDAATAGAPTTVTVRRDGEVVDLEVTIMDDGTGRNLLGVWVDPQFEMPLDVTIAIDNIGGPSAGLMFALGIIDRLTPQDETGGVHIAGTGTIDLAGLVGPIGGIQQKMYGAARDGAQWFLAPAGNCPEVIGGVPDGLRVVAVETLSQARAAVVAIGEGSGDSLPTCR